MSGGHGESSLCALRVRFAAAASASVMEGRAAPVPTALGPNAANSWGTSPDDVGGVVTN